MWIFTTREVSVIIYSIVFLIYVLIKKGKSVFLPVIKAACHIKLIVPFIFIVTMAIIFVWICNLKQKCSCTSAALGNCPEQHFFYYLPSATFLSSGGRPSPSPKSISRCASAISAFISTISTFNFSSHSLRVWA